MNHDFDKGLYSPLSDGRSCPLARSYARPNPRSRSRPCPRIVFASSSLSLFRVLFLCITPFLLPLPAHSLIENRLQSALPLRRPVVFARARSHFSSHAFVCIRSLVSLEWQQRQSVVTHVCAPCVRACP